MKNIILFSLAVIIVLLSLSWIASSQEKNANMTFSSLAPVPARAPTWAAWLVPTNIAKRSRKRSAPATTRGMLT